MLSPRYNTVAVKQTPVHFPSGQLHLQAAHKKCRKNELFGCLQGESRYPVAIQSDKPVFAVLSPFKWVSFSSRAESGQRCGSEQLNFELNCTGLTYEQVFSARQVLKKGVW